MNHRLKKTTKRVPNNVIVLAIYVISNARRYYLKIHFLKVGFPKSLQMHGQVNSKLSVVRTPL